MLLWFSWLAGCGERCDPATAEAYCDGAAVVSCPEPGVDQLVGANRWVRRDCLEGQVCVEAGLGAALCALDDQPDPLCADRGTACADGATQLYCSFGYATGTQECLACVDDGSTSTCEGGFGADCASGDDCVSGDCNDQGHCL